MKKKPKFFKAFTLKHEDKKDWIRFMPTNKDDIIAIRFTALGGMVQEGLAARERAVSIMTDLYAVGWRDIDEKANKPRQKA